MKRNIFVLATLLVVFVAVFALLAVRPVPKVRAQSPSCSESTLTGSLGLWAPGNTGSNGWDLSMLATFNGAGNFTGSHVYGVRGGAAVPGSNEDFSNGTYSVDADCRFTAKTNGLEVFGHRELTLEGFVVRGGFEVVGTWYSSDGPSGTFHAENVNSY
jgi:hypothetical protein